VVHEDSGEALRSVDAARPGDGLRIRLHDGEIAARVEDKETHERYKRTLF
jgi:exonuclease VII large subunit